MAGFCVPPPPLETFVISPATGQVAAAKCQSLVTESGTVADYLMKKKLKSGKKKGMDKARHEKMWNDKAMQIII